MLVYGVVSHERPLVWQALGVGAAALVCKLVEVVMATRTHCPLCHTPVLAKKHCRKHRNARTLLGSHRLYVSARALFGSSFRCPYCGEPSALEVRGRDSQRGYSRS